MKTLNILISAAALIGLTTATAHAQSSKMMMRNAQPEAEPKAEQESQDQDWKTLPGFADNRIGDDIGEAVVRVPGLNDRQYGVGAGTEITTTSDIRFLVSLDFYGFQLDKEPGNTSRLFEASVRLSPSGNAKELNRAEIRLRPYFKADNDGEDMTVNLELLPAYYKRDTILGEQHKIAINLIGFGPSTNNKVIPNSKFEGIFGYILEGLGYAIVNSLENKSTQHGISIIDFKFDIGAMGRISDNSSYRADLLANLDTSILGDGIELNTEVGPKTSLIFRINNYSDVEVFAKGGLRYRQHGRDDSKREDITYSYGFLETGINGRF